MSVMFNVKTTFGCLVLFSAISIWFLLGTSINYKEIYRDLALSRALCGDRNSTSISGNDWKNPPTIQISSDRWKYLGNSSLRYQIYSAYFDERLEVLENFKADKPNVLVGSVRVITILHLDIDKTKISCHFKYQDGTWKKVPAHHVVFINDYLWTVYVATFVICPITVDSNSLPKIDFPEEVGVIYDPEPTMQEATGTVTIKYPSNKYNLKEPVEFKNEMVVCSTPAYNFQNSRRIVEHVELWKKLGATKFYFYNKTISQSVDKVIRYYQAQGDMEIFNWTLNDYKFEEDLRCEGVFAAFNDCLYRAMIVDNVKYVANADYDEFLISRDGSSTLLEFMEKRENETINSFIFRMALMIQGNPEKFSPVPRNVKNDFLYSKVHVGRIADESLYLPHHIRSKYILNTRKSVELANHFVFKSVKNSVEYNVSINEGLLYHYEDDCGYDYCTPENTVDDYTARIYGQDLWSIVENVCGFIFEDGICPRD